MLHYANKAKNAEGNEMIGKLPTFPSLLFPKPPPSGDLCGQGPAPHQHCPPVFFPVVSVVLH